MKPKLKELLQYQPNLTLEQMAKALNTNVREVICALPDDMATLAMGNCVLELIESLPSWGKLTVIVQSEGSIFEFKGDFPKGTIAHGYYNFMHHESPFHGHLLIDDITDVALVSKPHRGSESHSIVFLSANGQCVFKVFLGRDQQRQLIPQQLQHFQKLKNSLKNAQCEPKLNTGN
ncbi:MAG: heme utilization cystosolic carrier protein HutX [Gammaproteobacteria bacterium]|nr:heme utilization cystosolic carrier protein HutX [Gammaproteobacteria bacterium]